MKARRRIGQATVEFALGTLLFVSILIIVLHLSEVSFLSLKVQEAATAAIWAATEQKVTDFADPNGGAIYSPYAQIGTNVSSAETKRYKNFDGITNATGTAGLFGKPQALWTQAGTLQVTCKRTSGGAFGSVGIPGGNGAIVSELRKWYKPSGAIECNATADALPFRLPTKFATQRSGFWEKEDLLGNTPPRRYQLCGVGSPVSGKCGRSSFSLLLGDWALDGDPQNSNLVTQYPLSSNPGVTQTPQTFSPVSQCQPLGDKTHNSPYCEMIFHLFKANQYAYYKPANASYQGPAAKFAVSMGGAILNDPKYNTSIYRAQGYSPYEEQKFSMSYVGAEGDPWAYDRTLVGSAFEPYVDELRPYASRWNDPRYSCQQQCQRVCQNGTCTNQCKRICWCDSCHYNTNGSTTVDIEPTPRQDYDRLRYNCFLGIGDSQASRICQQTWWPP